MLNSFTNLQGSSGGVVGKVITLIGSQISIMAPPDLFIRCILDEVQIKLVREGQYVLVVGTTHRDPTSGRLLEINPVAQLEVLSGLA